MSSDKDGDDENQTANKKINNGNKLSNPEGIHRGNGSNVIKNENKNGVNSLSGLLGKMCLGDDKCKTNISENKQHQEIKNTVTIPEWLKDCESPFSWHLEQERGVGPELIILRTLEKLDDLLIEEPEFSLQRFVSLLKLVLEYYVTDNINKCCEYMKIIEGCLEEEMLRNEPLYQKVKLSLGHIISATKAHVLHIIGKEEESKKIGQCIIPIKILMDSDKAALCSMKARFFLYSGYENGEEVGASYARKALELEPDNAEWEYLLAKMLRQQRREVPFSTEVPRDELKLLESAVNKDKNSKYLVYLAQVYRECSSQAFRQYRNHPNFHGELQASVELMAIKSLELYKEALTLDPDSPAALRRIGYGIMNLPKKFADYDMALECLLKSLDISENQMTLHVLGTFYHKFRKDDRKALEYFERTAKAGSWFGLSDVIRVKWQLDNNYDPCPDFEVALSWKMKKKNHTQVLTQLGGYHLFIRRDFYKAIEIFKKVIVDDEDSPHMTNFKSFFLRMNEPINLYRYLVNEALLLIQKQDSSSTVEPETSDEESTVDTHSANLGYVEDFLELISGVHPELMELTPDGRLIPTLIQTSKDIEAKCNYPGRNNFRGRGRGGNFCGNRSGRGKFSRNRSREPGDDNERRGRFSHGNQRERGSGSGERRGGSYRGRGRGQGQRNENWRQGAKNKEGTGDQGHENWRRK